jgi:hypothetical protein
MEDDRHHPSTPAEDKEREVALDRANRDSFPASDPPALIQPQRSTDKPFQARRKRP